MAVEGGTAAQLTKGIFEVENVSITEDRKELLLSSNQDDIDRRHIWRVSVSGGPARAGVTSGADLEWLPVATNGGVAFLHAAARNSQPVRPFSWAAPSKTWRPIPSPPIFR